MPIVIRAIAKKQKKDGRIEQLELGFRKTGVIVNGDREGCLRGCLVGDMRCQDGSGSAP